MSRASLSDLSYHLQVVKGNPRKPHGYAKACWQVAIRGKSDKLPGHTEHLWHNQAESQLASVPCRTLGRVHAMVRSDLAGPPNDALPSCAREKEEAKRRRELSRWP